MQTGGPNDLTLLIVKPKRLCPSINGTNCLGKDSRDNGHNLVPEPPQSITDLIIVVILMLPINFYITCWLKICGSKPPIAFKVDCLPTIPQTFESKP